ncbi:hypothetical protein JOB18_020637 [Solea senegalensis]|uniref:Uncharacterized protein n=1 Tax=Solea senegalensis TaxID=28829 RepID=A0AAV6Q6D2_SOLSE|nr:hypothetical protein JOB18_020637 [Solea senegalensis]
MATEAQRNYKHICGQKSENGAHFTTPRCERVEKRAEPEKKIRVEGEICAVASSLLTGEEQRVQLGWISTGSPENRVWSHTEVWILGAQAKSKTR